jgi:hypothetical protein
VTVWNWHNENGFDRHWKGGHTRYCAVGKECPDDQNPLRCLEDYYGGGSHYWTLRCDKCGKRYTFDTYGFELRHWSA